MISQISSVFLDVHIALCEIVEHWQLRCGVKTGEALRGVKISLSAIQAPIRHKRPNFKISYFRPSKCRPLHSAAQGGCPRRPPSRRHWKYKLQQLFKMLFLSLDTGLELFSPLVLALSTMVSWKSASGQTLTTRGFMFRSHIGFFSLLVYAFLHGSVVAMETAQLALNPYQALQTQSIRN